MPAADTARLIASLELDPRKFNRGVGQAMGGLGKLENRLGAIGSHARRGVANATGNLVRLGAVATAALGANIAAGIDSLATLEDATTAVDGAIKQMGKSGQVTAAQIAGWANEIEAASDAAFDDKDITAATASLIRYGRVTTANLRPAMQVMTDLAVQTGDVGSASSALGKALADPTKATRVLRTVGVRLNEEQTKTLKLWVKQGKLGKAQAFILREVGKATQDAAKDSAGPMRDMQNTLRDTVEDAQRLVAEGSFPVLQRLGERVRTALADPQTMTDIRNLGRGAADVLDSAIEFAGRVPWNQIKDALRIGGTGAKAILDAFTGMPPWVQTAVISGWGLNKLTGGALGDIVGEIGKGLIKGVLGMNAAVVNIRAGVVNGGGGATVVPGGGGKPGLGNRLLTGAAAVAGPLSLAAIAAETQPAVNQIAKDWRQQIIDAGIPLPDMSWTKNLDWPLGPRNAPTILPEIFGGNGLLGGTGRVAGAGRGFGTDNRMFAPVVGGIRESSKAADIAASGIENTTRSGTTGTTAAVNTAASRFVGAVQGLPPPQVHVNTQVNVTATSVEKNTYTSTQYGPRNGSQGGGSTGSQGHKYE